MKKGKLCCPLCNKPLTEQEYLNITGRWEKLRELETKFRKKLKADVDQARRSERQKVSDQFVLYQRQVVKLRDQLKRYKEQSERGLTPQLEGLLYEKELAKQLRQKFRNDRILPTGKGGDVVQRVYLNGKQAGTIVYECKKVAKLQKSHVEQARRAMVQRSADFSVLVTTAKASNTFGFWFKKDVLVIHPAGALSLAAWLRDILIELAMARIPKSQREKAVREILAFLASPEFKNAVQDATRRTEELGRELQDEIRSHRSVWLRRLDHYRAIWLDAHNIVRGVAKITEAHSFSGTHRKLLKPAKEESKKYPLEKDVIFQTA